jgi:hypothetical protein
MDPKLITFFLVLLFFPSFFVLGLTILAVAIFTFLEYRQITFGMALQGIRTIISRRKKRLQPTPYI